MNLVKRNLIIGVIAGFGVLGTTDPGSLQWSDTPQIIGAIIGGGIGGVVGFVASNPFIIGATVAAGSLIGGKVAPFLAGF